MATEVVLNGKEQHEEPSVPTYAEAFPPLLSAGGPSVSEAPVKSLRISNVTQVFHVPVEERRRELHKTFGGDTKQSVIVKDVMGQTGCTIEICAAKDSSLSIMVTGKPDAVVKARKLVLSQLQTQAHVELCIPKEHYRFILGKGGVKLKQLQDLTATKIDIPNIDSPSDVIKIFGTKDGIELARHKIQTISDEQAKVASERISVEKKYHPFINGPGGAQVKSLADQTGARINMPPPSVMSDEIVIVGDKEGVAKAVLTIKKLYDDLKIVCGTVSVEVKKAQHKYVIGPRRQGIQDILEATGVSVEMPSSESDSATVTLRGPKEKLGAALSKVYERASSCVTEEIVVPSWLHRFIIGRKGENVRTITENLPKLHLEFKEESDLIVLEGPQSEVLEAKAKVQSFAEDLLKTMAFVEVTVDPKYHRHIIGKGGANISRIKKETGTSILVPTDDHPHGVIRIEGDPERVQIAKKAIMDLANKMENERVKDLIMEQRFHSKIIGAGGEGLQDLRSQYPGVQINFPRQSEKSDIVQLRGPKEQVEGCSVALKKKYKDLLESNYRLEVRILKKCHSSIVGKGGATLRKIRDDTGARIDLPTEKSASDVIVIIGRKESAEKARDMILAVEKQLANVVEEVVEIPRKHHNSIIGPKGQLIRSVMEDYAVRISFPPSSSSSSEVKISGPREEVQKARAVLEEMASASALEGHSTELKVRPEYHRFLIGRNGTKIKKVREDFEVRVIFPHKSGEGDQDLIAIIGRREKTEAAKTHLQKMVEDLEKVVEDEISVSPKYHKHFIQRRGQVIREISEDNGGVIVSFPKQGSDVDRVSLKGAKECIEGAKARITEIIEDLEAQVTLECVISRTHHRSILGNRGANVQAITEKWSVNIKFPDRTAPPAQTEGKAEGEAEGEAEGKAEGEAEGEGKAEGKAEGEAEGEGKAEGKGDVVGEDQVDSRDVITITGRREHCESAKEALLAVVPVAIDVPVPNDYHRYIIGQKGREVRALMEEFDVQITIPPSEEQLDSITVVGPPTKAEEARKAIEQKVQQLNAEKEDRELRSYKEMVEVDGQYHSKIIGKKGATIDKIRKEHEVQIQFPDREGPTPNIIEITGYEHRAKAARDAILKIVEELEEQITVEVEVDHRVHSRLIGQKGRTIAKVMDQFKVDIRFPKDKGSDMVTITGLEESVMDARDEILNRADDFMEDVRMKEEEMELQKMYTRNQGGHRNSKQDSKLGPEFKVRDAPWQNKDSIEEDFPAIAGVEPVVEPPTTNTTKWQPPSWGPKRKY